MRSFAQMGLCVPELLLPDAPVESSWACVACDQYTSQPQVWRRLEELVGEKPSTLRMVLPECYLSQAEDRLPRMLDAMERYQTGVLNRRVRGFVLTRRTTQSGSRLGLVVAVDLEAYDFSPDSASPIRATEGTIVERLPPRIRVRERASLECSHILLLANDPQRTLLEPLYARLAPHPPLYDLDLPLEGGRLTGWAVQGEELERVREALSSLWEQRGRQPFLAVGDGNHSLATAKAIWQKRRLDAPADHPARYAMCELTNLFDPALVFEPIHRCLFSVQPQALSRALEPFDGEAASPKTRPAPGQALLCGAGGATLYRSLPLRSLQGLLDRLQGEAFERLDYVHGDRTALELGAKPGNAAILLPAMDKYTLFDAIASGPLPRKAFSMGQANEKRYYMECRRILP